jgi:hypothetical protein
MDFEISIRSFCRSVDYVARAKWCVVFEMDEAFPAGFVTITDQGTCGLTGKAIVPKDELDRLEASEPRALSSF